LRADAFERRGIDHAIGGALALGDYATPRASVDVDINVLVPSRLQDALRVLSATGFEPDDPTTLERTAIEDGPFRGRISGVRVAVFVPAIEFYASVNERKRRFTLLDRPTCVLDREDLRILELMLFRRKDLADAEAILLGPEPVGVDRVRATRADFAGEDDPRIEEWEELVRDRRGGRP
jgi:hypothetical protein